MIKLTNVNDEVVDARKVLRTSPDSDQQQTDSSYFTNRQATIALNNYLNTTVCSQQLLKICAN
jgi:hypothetical protein